MSVRKRNAQDKRNMASRALVTRLEEFEATKATGRLILEINIHHGGIVNASISMQEPVFKSPPKTGG